MKTFFERLTRWSPARAPTLMRGFLSGERGSVAIMLGVALSAMMGMVALGTEITFVLYKQRQMQAAADSAALGAGTALSRGYPAFALEARAIAGTGGFVDGVGGATVTVNMPPLTGSNAGVATAVEVVIVQPQALQLASLFTEAAFDVNARAVALQGSSGSFCAMSTDTSSGTGINISGGTTVNFNECGVAVNSSGATALSVTGGSTLNTASATVTGQARVNGGGVINATNGVAINQPVTADPYAAVNAPAPAGCNWTNRSLGWAPVIPQQLYAGTYCNNLSIGNGTSVHFNPGTYYIKSGTLNFAGGTTITGTGVTFVMTNNSNTNYARVTIGGGAIVTLSAPSTGTLAGLVFYADRNSPTSTTNSFAGGSTLKLTGGLYFPTQQVTYSNGAENPPTCTQLIAWRIQFTGGVSFNNDCGSAGTTPIGGGSATTLVE